MQRLQFNAEDLAKVRLATGRSPFTEVLFSLRWLGRSRRSVLLDGWDRAVRNQLPPETALLLTVSPPSPPPVDRYMAVGCAPSMDAALESLRAAPVEHLRTEMISLRRLFARAATWKRTWLRALADGDPEARRELVKQYSAYHQRAVEPYWDRISHHLDTERARQARAMAAGGVDALLTTLHPRVRWRPPFLDVGDTADEAGPVRSSRPVPRLSPEPIVLGGRSLVLFPTVFDLDGPRVVRSTADETRPVVLLYPTLRHPSDAMALWTPPEAPTHRALAMLIGKTRARALEAIANTCTTTELARQTDVSLPTASHHVGVLRAAGLITSDRAGIAVVHRITPAGAMLLHGGRSSSPPSPAPPPGAAGAVTRPLHAFRID